MNRAELFEVGIPASRHTVAGHPKSLEGVVWVKKNEFCSKTLFINFKHHKQCFLSNFFHFFFDLNPPPGGGLKILPGVEIFETSPLAAAPRRPDEELDQARHTKSCAGSQG